MSQKPLVTVGIPCFNAARWVRGAIDSALALTGIEKEIIVIDDGSFDGSLDILKSYGDAIRLYSTENNGVNVARNHILRHAQGKWIQYLDADDYLRPPKVAVQLSEAADADAYDVIYSPVLAEYWQDESPRQIDVMPIDDSLDLFAQWFAWQLPQTSGSLWKKEVLERLGGWNEARDVMCDEHELYSRALQEGCRFHFAPTPNAVYRIWSEQTRSQRQPQALFNDKLNLFLSMRQWLVRRDTWKRDYQRIAGQACFEMSRTLARYDVATASRFYSLCEGHGLMALAGPAAPLHYQMCFRVFGFALTESLANRLRRKK